MTRSRTATWTFRVEVQLGQADQALAAPLLSGACVLAATPSGSSREALARQLAAFGAEAEVFAELTALRERLRRGPAPAALLVDPRSSPEPLEAVAEGLVSAAPTALMVSMAELTEAEQHGTLGFRATLPRPMVDLDYARLATLLAGGAGVERKASDRPSFPGLRVLLVEDNAVNQMVAKGLLGKLGVEVTVAGDGEEALERLREARFDLVLMDCQMPRLDGFAATRAIRRGEAGPEATAMPIVAMTANALEGDRERCLEAGMNEYLTKPVRPAALAATLGDVLAAPLPRSA